MTIPRFLIVVAILVGLAAATLSFAPPQTHRWVYMWQAYVLQDKYVFGVPRSKLRSLTPNTVVLERMLKNVIEPGSYTGEWRIWDREGNLMARYALKDGVMNGWSHLHLGSEHPTIWARYVDGAAVAGCWGSRFSGGKPGKIEYMETGDPDSYAVIFDSAKKIDRRAELGVPVE